jgi:DNA-directed RNA polymerase subunit L
MESNVITNTSKQLELEIIGENETLLNPLVQVLLTYDEVDYASIITKHPSAPSRILYLRLISGAKAKPTDLLKKAVKEVKKETDTFKKELEKVLK